MSNPLNQIPRWVKVTAGLITTVLVGAFIFWVGWVDFVDNYELGYTYDKRTGKITVLQKKGYIVTPPFLVSVHTVDLRPMQVCINANARVLNCKLVQFDPAGLQTFVDWHGRDNYDGPSATSTHTSPGSLEDILKSYAFDGLEKSYPFLRIIRELKNQEGIDPFSSDEAILEQSLQDSLLNTVTDTLELDTLGE